MKNIIYIILICLMSVFITSCKKSSSAKSQLNTIVKHLNDSMPVSVNEDIECKKIVLENNVMTYHYSVATEYIGKLSIAKTRSSHLENIKSQNMERLASCLVKDKVALSYLYTDSLTTVVFNISPEEISELIPSEKEGGE